MTRAWNGDRQARGMVVERCGYSSDPETAPDDQLALGEHWLFTAGASTRSAIASRWPR